MILHTFSASFLAFPLRSNPFLRQPAVRFCAVLAFFIPLAVTSLFAQTPQKSDRSDPVDEPATSDYLDRHHASRNIDQLKKNVEIDIRRLGVLVRNMGQDVAGSDKEYSDIAAIYRKAVESYYGGDPLDAYRHLLASRARALDLYKKFSEMYRTKTVQMAADITQQIAGMETDPDQKVSFFAINEARHRLSVARSQIQLGDDMIRFRRPDRAIDQYRNARLMTILTAYHLAEDPAKRKEILKKYEADLKDIGYRTDNLVEEIVPDQPVKPGQ